jgi:serine/threonine protein kinase
MEYIPNCCLKDYLGAHNDKISKTQRVRETAKELQLLHSADVIHCDMEPKNLLLDAGLGIRIADFSGSSLKGSQASACAGTRFLPPAFNLRTPPMIQQDLFSFGSTINNVMTGKAPFQELQSNKVKELYKANEFPDMTGLLYGDITKQCWNYEIPFAQEV